MKVCESCGKQNQDRAKFCTGCGRPLPVIAMAPHPEPAAAPTPAPAPVPAGLAPTPIRAPKPLVSSPPVGGAAPTLFAEAAPKPAPNPLASAETPPHPQPSPSGPFEAPRAAPKPPLVVRTPSGRQQQINPAPMTGAPVHRHSNPAAETIPATDAPDLAKLLAPKAVASVSPAPLASMATLPAPEEQPEPVTLIAAQSPAKRVPTPIGTKPAIPVPSPTPIPAAPAPEAASTPCPRCATPIPAGFIFCGRCGFDLRTLPTETPAVSPTLDEPTPVPSGPVPDLVLLTPDGQESARYPLAHGEFTVGRTEGAELSFAENLFLNERHATFTWANGQLSVRDLQSTNGIFIKIHQEERLQSGDFICIGQQFFRFEVSEIVPSPSQAPDGTYRHGAPLPDIGARLVLVCMGGSEYDIYYLRGEETVIGRVTGDIIFGRDNFISRSHAKVISRNGEFFLMDLGSSNGTFLQIREEATLADRDLLLMGDQLFRLELPR